ncbi:MAG: hypothetical protein UT33_C0012G0050 [Candidatus Peregrinibacteria bacterium GW2011_GWC2_39_14]|nr:MAG: hypothetical protein US92_C0003G0077 [Candidatus Peregrinibacteria bacterium GW2011_GWA2_38_36]KKR05245.1 MAG: hypothetical protein UT33_C0012G0050 [Candidatus Peregrinibacteria bacterium GW2011_GWC2_39_14]
MTREEDNWGGIVFYCKDCEKIVQADRAFGKKYVYKCRICKTKNVAFGTEKSIATYFHIEEEAPKVEVAKDSKPVPVENAAK